MSLAARLAGAMVVLVLFTATALGLLARSGVLGAVVAVTAGLALAAVLVRWLGRSLTRMTSALEAEVEARQRIEERFRLVVESAPSGMLIVDAEGRIQLVNVGAERLFGYRREELLGQPVERLVPAGFRARHPELRAGFMAAPEMRQMGVGRDLRAVRRDGSELPVEVGLSPLQAREGSQVLCTVVDITERKSAEEALAERTRDLEREVDDRRRAEERFRLVVESSPSGMLIVDGEGTIQLVNAAAERLFGYRREELLGQPVERLVPAGFRARHPELRAGFMAAPEVRQMGVGRDLRAVGRDGSELPVEVGLSPLQAREGSQVLCTVVDITERKSAEEAFAERTRELERSNADLEQFAYVASHDLQEPLRMVASYSQLLGDRYRGQLDERADKYIHHLVDGARRMQQLVNDLLAYSRVGTQGASLEPTDVGAVLDGVLGAMHRTIEESGAEIVRGAAPTVVADELQLGQVLQNLISNALKFRGDAPPRIEIGAERIDGAWRFAVADNGIGIEEEHATRIFQMFQRLHERGKYQGNGIGLAIAKKIVERHGGRIWFESKTGEGTTFYFTIPCVRERET